MYLSRGFENIFIKNKVVYLSFIHHVDSICCVLPSPFQQLDFPSPPIVDYTQVGVAHLSAWFTFIFRTTGLHAVVDFIGEDLRTLVGHTPYFSSHLSQDFDFSHPLTHILYHVKTHLSIP